MLHCMPGTELSREFMSVFQWQHALVAAHMALCGRSCTRTQEMQLSLTFSSSSASSVSWHRTCSMVCTCISGHHIRMEARPDEAGGG